MNDAHFPLDKSKGTAKNVVSDLKGRPLSLVFWVFSCLAMLACWERLSLQPMLLLVCFPAALWDFSLTFSPCNKNNANHLEQVQSHLHMRGLIINAFGPLQFGDI